MNLNKKRGITVTSIVLYVILFFMFTTVATVISSRLNRSLFEDRGEAINITAINKLEYNLLNSANNSYVVEGNIEGNITTLTFSNSDVYTFDLDKNVVLKNGGKLVNFVKEFDVKLLDDLIDMNITLNKYTHEVSRNIKISIATKPYISKGLIAHYDGINNMGGKIHDDASATWQDLSNSKGVATLSSNFTHDASTNGWVENGLLFPQGTNAYTHNVSAIYNTNIYSSMTFEITMTFVTEPSTGGNDYVIPFWLYVSDNSNNFRFGFRKNAIFTYGFGNDTVYATGISMIKNKNYTLTIIHDGLNRRALYINGVLIGERTNLNLNNIEFYNPKMLSSNKGAYIIHSLRIYNEALTTNDIKINHMVDRLRFGE